MDEILGNFYILIPIAVVVVFRILAARKKGEPLTGSFSSPQAEAPGSPDDGEDYAPPRLSPAGARRKPEAPAVKPLAASAEAPPPESRPAKAGVSAAPPPPDRGFPHNLERLPPLKRALVLSEILGPPKALG
jgi:hypothetical protein